MPCYSCECRAATSQSKNVSNNHWGCAGTRAATENAVNGQWHGGRP